MNRIFRSWKCSRSSVTAASASLVGMSPALAITTSGSEPWSLLALFQMLRPLVQWPIASSMEDAIGHCTKGLSIWNKASNDQGSEPDVVIASAGDIPTKEALAAVTLLREHFHDLKIRFINVVDLYKLVPSSEHPHGLSDRDFDSLFTTDRPIIFNFHGYPWLIHRLTYRRTNHKNLHVRGYKEKGNINTPLDLAIQNQIDRFSLAIDVIDRVPSLQRVGAHAKEKLRNTQIECQKYAYQYGVDKPEIDQWTWPY